MRTLACLVVGCLALVACGKSAPPEWTTADYVAAGTPAPDHFWSPAELTKAGKVLADHPGHLPRFHHPGSGAVFARLVERSPADDIKVRIDGRFQLHAERYAALADLMHLYTDGATAHPPRESIELFGVLIAEAVVLNTLAEAFLASFPPGDPKLATRKDGLAQMKKGFAGIMMGSMMVASDASVDEADRAALLAFVGEGVGPLWDALSDDDRVQLRAAAKSQVAGSTGPRHDAAARILYNMPLEAPLPPQQHHD